MKCYADTSFIGQFLVPDFATAAARAVFQRLRRPPLLYTGLHELELTNLLRLRVFAAGHAAERSRTRTETALAVRRLQHMEQTAMLQRTLLDWEVVASQAANYSVRHTEKLGTRAMDLLHVAAAVSLNARLFLTCDRRQAALAKATGLKSECVSPL